MGADEDVDSRMRARRPRPELVIEYLRYAVSDVRALSPRSTKLLEEAIAVLVDDTSGARDSDRNVPSHSGTNV